LRIQFWFFISLLRTRGCPSSFFQFPFIFLYVGVGPPSHPTLDPTSFGLDEIPPSPNEPHPALPSPHSRFFFWASIQASPSHFPHRQTLIFPSKALTAVFPCPSVLCHSFSLLRKFRLWPPPSFTFFLLPFSGSRRNAVFWTGRPRTPFPLATSRPSRFEPLTHPNLNLVLLSFFLCENFSRRRLLCSHFCTPDPNRATHRTIFFKPGCFFENWFFLPSQIRGVLSWVGESFSPFVPAGFL